MGILHKLKGMKRDFDSERKWHSELKEAEKREYEYAYHRERVKAGLVAARKAAISRARTQVANSRKPVAQKLRDAYAPIAPIVRSGVVAMKANQKKWKETHKEFRFI